MIDIDTRGTLASPSTRPIVRHRVQGRMLVHGTESARNTKQDLGRTFCASIVCSIVFVENISKIPHSVTYTDERARAQIMPFLPP